VLRVRTVGRRKQATGAADAAAVKMRRAVAGARRHNSRR